MTKEREALKQIAGFTLSQFMGPHDMALACVDVAREALAQPAVPQGNEQDPWGACVFGRVFVGALPEHVRKLSEDEALPIQWLYTTPPKAKEPEQEPVAIADGTFNHNCPIGTPLYTTPPQRKPLTENEFLKLVDQDYKLFGECFNAYQIEGALVHSSDKQFQPVKWVWKLKTMIEAAHGIKGDA